jgi:two-component system alkaline phosphatase synthesis response regulator PhoP
MIPETASILVVDDQVLTLAAIQATLELDGFQVYTAKDGIEALEVLRVTEIDVILADIAMPRMNGYELFETVRQDKRWIHIPFIFLTARTMDSDIRYGKELGVDDYLTKPFRMEDLRASVAGKLRRSKQLTRFTAPATQDIERQKGVLVIDELRINPEQHRLWVGETEVPLSIKEFALLLHLARHAGKVITLGELCHVTHDLTTNNVEAGSLLYPLIRSLRTKLAAHQVNPEKIQSVRGVGYCLV